MTDRLKTELFRAACNAFEQVAFMVPSEDVDGDDPPEGFEAVAVDIAGALSGRMVLGVSGTMLSSLASNMLGEDVALPLDQQRDALGEVANIVAGAFLPAIDPAGVFSIAAPERANLDEERVRPGAGRAVRLRIGLDEGKAELLLWLHSQDDRP